MISDYDRPTALEKFFLVFFMAAILVTLGIVV